MTSPGKNMFISNQVILTNDNLTNQKTVSIPIIYNQKKQKKKVVDAMPDSPLEADIRQNSTSSSSKSWTEYNRRNQFGYHFPVSPINEFTFNDDRYHKQNNRYSQYLTLDNNQSKSISPSNKYVSPRNKLISPESKSKSISPDSKSNSTSPIYEENFEQQIKLYDAVEYCKSAGIIPYTIHNGIVLFLFQKEIDPSRKKNSGLNDFGGKRINNMESTAEIAAREFSEETSCLFYLQENINFNENNKYYDLLKDNDTLFYDDYIIDILKKLIPISQKYYYNKIMDLTSPIYVSSKETYISYFVKVPYIPENEIPRAEDIHIPYDVRYIRKCEWYTFNKLMELNPTDFHKRLQITKIQHRISNYYHKRLFG